MLHQPLLIGLWIGLIHAFDADHITTLGSLAVRGRPRSAIGYAARWACGHAVAIGALGALALGVGMLWIASVSHVAELGVATLLIALGINTIVSVWRRDTALALAGGEARPARSRHQATGLVMGLLHGGAGSAAVLALLPLSGFDSGFEAVGFLVSFSAGVAAGALAFAALFSGLLAGTLRRGETIVAAIASIVGVLAVVVGAAMLFGNLDGG